MYVQGRKNGKVKRKDRKEGDTELIMFSQPTRTEMNNSIPQGPKVKWKNKSIA